MRVHIAILALAVFLLTGCGAANAARANARGNDAYEQQAYDVALASYQEALEARPALPQALYNLGNAHYRLQESEEAQRRPGGCRRSRRRV